MFSLKILTLPSFWVDVKIIDEVAKVISKTVKKTQKWTLNLVFVDANSIKNLNNVYRKKNYVTDVLSFHYFDEFSDLKKSDVAGEIVFCEEKIISQGKEYWLWTEKEFYKLLIHSVLHILWYDHEEDGDYETMKEIEKIVWENIFDTNKKLR